MGFDTKTIYQLYNSRITRKEAEGKTLEQAIKETEEELAPLIENELKNQNMKIGAENINYSDDAATATQDISRAIETLKKYTPQSGYISDVKLEYSPEEITKYVQQLVTLANPQLKENKQYEGYMMESPFGYSYRYSSPIGALSSLIDAYKTAKENEEIQKTAKQTVEQAQKIVGDKFGIKNISVGYNIKPEYALGGGSTPKKTYWFQEYNKVVEAAKHKDIAGIKDIIGFLKSDILRPYEIMALNDGDYTSVLPIIVEKYTFLSNVDDLAKKSESLNEPNKIKSYYEEIYNYSRQYTAPILYEYFRKYIGLDDKRAKEETLGTINYHLNEIVNSINKRLDNVSTIDFTPLTEIKKLDAEDFNNDILYGKLLKKIKDEDFWRNVELNIKNYKNTQDRINFILNTLQEEFGDTLGNITDENKRDELFKELSDVVYKKYNLKLNMNTE